MPRRTLARCAAIACVVAIAATAAVATRLPMGAALGAGFASGLSSFVGAVFFAGSRREAGERRLIASADRPGRVLKDRERTAIVGTLELDGPDVVTPFGNVSCAAYTWQMIAPEKQGEREIQRETRGADAASVKIHSASGRFALLDPPRLKGFDAEIIYPFRTTVDIGALRLRLPPTLALENLMHEKDSRVVEMCAHAGDRVCAVGRYSAAANGLDAGAGALYMVKGGISEAMALLAKGSALSYVASICFFAVSAAIVFFAWRA